MKDIRRKGLEISITLPTVSHKEEGRTVIDWNWGWGYRELDVTKTGLAFLYKWVLTIGWIQIRARQTESFEVLFERALRSEKSEEVK